jgi:hypothetical protein
MWSSSRIARNSALVILSLSSGQPRQPVPAFHSPTPRGVRMPRSFSARAMVRRLRAPKRRVVMLRSSQCAAIFEKGCRPAKAAGCASRRRARFVLSSASLCYNARHDRHTSSHPAPRAPVGASAELPRRDSREDRHRHRDRRGDGCREGQAEIGPGPAAPASPIRLSRGALAAARPIAWCHHLSRRDLMTFKADLCDQETSRHRRSKVA